MHESALPCQMSDTDDKTMATTRRTPSRRDRRPLSALLCVWVLVSERGLEPPRGYTPHQVLSLARLPVPPGANATS